MKKIMVVDDQVEVRELVEVTLRSDDYEIIQAENGTEAIEKARAEKPDFIILDIMMPKGMDGYEVCKILKNDPATKGIIIIFLTAKGQMVDKEKGLAAGADGYFSKPFSPLQLINKIEEFL